MWTDVVVKLKSKQIKNFVGHYVYKSYFNNTFNHFLLSSKLRHVQEFPAADATDFDELPGMDTTKLKNPGALIRSSLTKNSTMCTLFGPILEYFLAIDNFKPPKQDL